MLDRLVLDPYALSALARTCRAGRQAALRMRDALYPEWRDVHRGLRWRLAQALAGIGFVERWAAEARDRLLLYQGALLPPEAPWAAGNRSGPTGWGGDSSGSGINSNSKKRKRARSARLADQQLVDQCIEALNDAMATAATTAAALLRGVSGGAEALRAATERSWAAGEAAGPLSAGWQADDGWGPGRLPGERRWCGPFAVCGALWDERERRGDVRMGFAVGGRCTPPGGPSGSSGPSGPSGPSDSYPSQATEAELLHTVCSADAAALVAALLAPQLDRLQRVVAAHEAKKARALADEDARFDALPEDSLERMYPSNELLRKRARLFRRASFPVAKRIDGSRLLRAVDAAVLATQRLAEVPGCVYDHQSVGWWFRDHWCRAGELPTQHD